jgi:alpha-amylase/alpha-mannosidase (GH57 family)
MTWPELRYRPHIARHGGEEIVVVVRDRELSDAQESGMELDWFLNEITERTRWCDFPPLVTTCTDGENGGWFRNVTEGANFWSAFYRPFLERFRLGQAPVAPTFISDYLNVHGTHGEVRVRTGAWNTGWHHGRDFTQWTGSELQRQTLEDVAALSEAVQAARIQVTEHGLAGEEVVKRDLEDATWHLLRAETSCNFFWGEAWVCRADADMKAAEQALWRIRGRLGHRSAPEGAA